MAVDYKDPAWILFHRRFYCLVPTYCLAQFEEARYGRRMAGYDDLDDEQYSKQKERVRLPLLTEYDRDKVPCLAEINNMGVSITLINPAEDAPYIYDLIRNHLTAWRKTIQEVPTLPGTDEDLDAVLSDLSLLDSFQINLHRVAMNYIQGEPESLLLRKLKQHGSRSSSINRRKAETVETVVPRDISYTPLTQQLRKDILGRRKIGW